MSSAVMSLREFISERLAAAAEEIFRHCEGTIVQYEEELCRQRRLLDIIWKPQLQLHVMDLPQHYLRNQEKNSNGKQEEQEEPEPPQMVEEQEEPEPPQIKEEIEVICIGQDEEQLDLKQETDILMEIPTYQENYYSEADLNNQLSFNVTDSQDEERNQQEESTTDEETDSQNRDQWKRKDRSHVQSVASSSHSDINSEEKNSMINVLMETHEKKREGKKHTCKECGRSCTTAEGLKHHMRIHTGERPFSCKQCSKSFRQNSHLTCHMLTHTGEKPFSCKECSKHFRKNSHLTRHMLTHMGDNKGETPFSCTEWSKRFGQSSVLTHHMLTHAEEKLFSCTECSKIFRKNSHLTRHMLTHTGEKPFSCTECSKSFRQIYHLKYHMLTHTQQKQLSSSSAPPTLQNE